MVAHTLVIGVGNPDRGDDAAGLAVVHALSGKTPEAVAIRASSVDGAALLSEWQGFDIVVIVDAMPFTGRAGRVRRFDAVAQPLPADLFADSTHAFGVAQGVEMARALELLPPKLILFGIEGRDFTPGAPMSAEVAAAIPQAAAAILAELAQRRDKTAPG